MAVAVTELDRIIAELSKLTPNAYVRGLSIPRDRPVSCVSDVIHVEDRGYDPCGRATDIFVARLVTVDWERIESHPESPRQLKLRLQIMEVYEHWEDDPVVLLWQQDASKAIGGVFLMNESIRDFHVYRQGDASSSTYLLTFATARLLQGDL